MSNSTATQGTSSRARTRNAIVTGASRGIGRAIAVRLAADGFTVAVHSGQDVEAAKETVSNITRDGGRAFAFQANLAHNNAGNELWASFDEAAVEAGIEGTTVHTIVNNAGITARGSIDELSQEDYLSQQAINVNAPYFIIKHGLQRLCEGGRIINISSLVTRRAQPDVIGYAMTKGAIETFTFTLAKYLGYRGITVNAVSPGVIDTDMNATWLRGSPKVVAEAVAKVALGRLGTPSDVADVVAFLASHRGRWITGQVLDASGGTEL